MERNKFWMLVASVDAITESIGGRFIEKACEQEVSE